MTLYQEYQNRIKDIKYIFDSGVVEILDFQYILVLIHESIYNISLELQDEVKEVFNKLDFSSGKNTKDLQDPDYYFYIFSLIKNDLNSSGCISNEVKKIIELILTEVEKSISDIENEDELKVEQTMQSSCSGVCSQCNNGCFNDNDIAVKPEVEKIVKNKEFLKQKYNNTNIFENIYLNSNYIKDYLINNSLIKYECENCGLNSWQNNYLKLEIDYIDGNPNNQQINNIRLLCPNCFSQVGHV